MVFQFIKNLWSDNKLWQETDKDTYIQACKQYGNSFLTHPVVISAMCSMLNISEVYSACYSEDKLAGSIANWGPYLAGDKRYLKKLNLRREIDTGNAEVILPVSNQTHIPLPVKGQFISELNHKSITNLKPQKETLSLARSIQSGGFSRKFRYNRRREVKLFKEAGGEIRQLEKLDEDQIAKIYIDLFQKRWGKKPKGEHRLAEFLAYIRPLIKGHYLTIDEQAIAVQLIYISEGEKVISAEYINGGVDLAYSQYSPGSILSFLNIQMAESIAQEKQLPLRFSFGITDKEYKNNWCDPHPVFRC